MIRMAATFAVCLALAGAAPPFRSAEAQLPPGAPSTQAATVLQESYSLGDKLNEAERGRFLNDLVIVAPDIAPGRVIDLAGELIKMTQTSKDIPEWDKIAYQKNAAVALSKVDPVAAMQSFSEIGPPAPSINEKRLPEDIRAFGARTLFLNYFNAPGRGIKALPVIEQQSARLADTGGAYPFHAVSLILAQLGTMGKEGQAEADKLFSQAVKYYSCESRVENEHLEFFTLLQNAKPVVNNTLLTGAVHQFVKNLADPNCDKRPKTDGYLAVIQTSDGSPPVHLADESGALLFQAFSLIAEVDPPFAAKLQQDDIRLAGAGAPITEFAATFFPANAPPEQQAQYQKMGLQRALMRGIRSLRESNPQGALQVADLIEEPVNRTVAVASVLPTLARWDMPRAKQLYVQELDNLNSLPEGPQKSQINVWMAEAAYQSADFDNFEYLAAKTFDDSVNEFEASFAADSGSSKHPADTRSGYQNLSELVEFGGTHNVSWILDKVRELKNPTLKAHLIMYAAKGLARGSQ